MAPNEVEYHRPQLAESPTTINKTVYSESSRTEKSAAREIYIAMLVIAMQATKRPHSLFQKDDTTTYHRPRMMASDTFTDIQPGFDDEFDYEPIDFRLPPVSSPTKSHPHIYEYVSPRQSQDHYRHQHILYNCVSDVQSQGYYPSPIVRRQDPNAELVNKAPHCNSVGGNTLQSVKPVDCYSGYPLHNSTSESLPSPPKLLSQPRYGLAAPGPDDVDQRYHHVKQDVRFFPSYKPSDRWSDQHQYTHPSPPFSQMTVGVSSSSRSPPFNSTTSSFVYPASDMMLPTWDAHPPAVPQWAPRYTFQESDTDWPRGQNDIESGSPSSSMSPSNNYQYYDGAAMVATYNDIDVLCGRGGATNSHTGNRRFRKIVSAHRDAYLRAKKRDKPAYAQHVLELVRNQNRSKPCRFLKKHPTSDLYYDIGNEKAREKVAQA